jgi:hypothetical protein
MSTYPPEKQRMSESSISHADVTAIDTSCTRVYLVDGTSHLSVTTTRLTPEYVPARPPRYRVVIRRMGSSASGRPLSLMNIGVQGKHWHVALLQVIGTNVTLTREQAHPRGQIGPHSGVVTVNQRLRRIQPRGQSEADDTLVWLLQFEGDSCELLIAVRRPPYGAIFAVSEHDVTPPPPEGGGDEEEESEEEDDDTEDGGE